MAIIQNTSFLTTPTASGTTDLAAKVAELETRIAQLEKVLKVGASGDVALKAATSMTIEASMTMTLKSALIKLN